MSFYRNSDDCPPQLFPESMLSRDDVKTYPPAGSRSPDLIGSQGGSSTQAGHQRVIRDDLCWVWLGSPSKIESHSICWIFFRAGPQKLKASFQISLGKKNMIRWIPRHQGPPPQLSFVSSSLNRNVYPIGGFSSKEKHRKQLGVLGCISHRVHWTNGIFTYIYDTNQLLM